MTSPAETGPEALAAPPAPSRDADALTQAAAVLASIEGLPLEQHPPAFARFDELLRDALESTPPVSSG